MSESKILRVLNIEDSDRDALLLRRHLEKAGYALTFERVEDAPGMKSALEAKSWDVILADYALPAFDAIHALAVLKQSGLDIPFIIISGTIGEELAVEAMRAGASDYLMKGKLTRLSSVIERERDEVRNRNERKIAAAQLERLSTTVQQQRDRLNTIIATVPGIVWEAWGKPDVSTQRIDFVSDYVETMLGYSVDEWLATPNFWISIVHPDDRKVAGKEAAQCFAEKRSSTQTFRWIAKDGSIVWVETQFVIIVSVDGEPIGMRGVTVDISDRVRAQDALKDSEERYRLLFEGNPDPTFVFDKETLRIVAINESTVQEYGYSREELMALKMTAIFPAAEVPAFLDRLANLPYGPPRGTILRHQKKDGSLIDVEITRRPLLFSGRSAYVLIAHNVTQRRSLEEQFRQAQKMEAVGQLAGGIAHDFNNLLTVINGYSELIAANLSADDPLIEDVQLIGNAGKRAAALTRQLLAFSRKQVLLPTILNANHVIGELEKMLHRLIGEDVRLQTDLDPDVRSVKGDRGQVEQIVMNLVVNARDAMPSGGTLTIETRNVDAADVPQDQSTVPPGSYVMLAVRDTGIGMTPETQARIFEPFFTTKEAGKGTGLGLSTVYGIVHQSNGTIRVESQPGHGTTFKIYLPCATKDDPLPEKESPPTATELRGTETILLAEDDALVRTFASRVLSSHGYRVLEASNGGSALLMCERHNGPIHLLLTDVVMPELNGYNLSRRLIKIRPHMQVLYMSGYADSAIVHQEIIEDKTPFIQKPFTPLALTRKIREVLDKAFPLFSK